MSLQNQEQSIHFVHVCTDFAAHTLRCYEMNSGIKIVVPLLNTYTLPFPCLSRQQIMALGLSCGWSLITMSMDLCLITLIDTL